MDFKLISFDLDGTLIKIPAVAVILSFTRAGKIIEFNRFEDLLKQGKLSYEDALEKELKLLIGVPVSEAYKALDQAPFISGINETVLELKLFGFKTLLISDNPDFICEYVVRRFDIDDYLCTRTDIKDGIVAGFKSFLTDKYKEFSKYIKKFNIIERECIHVGDWDNDIPLFENVGLGIAINPKNERVKNSANLTIETDNLKDILKILKL